MKMLPYISLIRYRNCIMSSIAVAIGALVASGNAFTQHLIPVTIAMLVVFLFTGAGNGLNDVLDRNIDITAHPERPIPSGQLSARNARIFSALLFAVSVSASIALGPLPLLVVLLSLCIMLLYEFRLKVSGLPGNLSIAWLTASLFLFGAVSVGNLLPIWAFFITSFLATLGREIMKDIQDVEADKGVRRTLPMRVGDVNAKWAAALSLAGAILVSPFPYLLHQFQIQYLAAVMLADAIFVYAALEQKTDAGKAQNISKVAMYVAMVAFLVGAVRL